MTSPQLECSMASAQDFNQSPQTSVVHHIVIKYQQPPDLAIVNYVLEILIGITRTFSLKRFSSNTIYLRLHEPNNSTVTSSL